MQRNAQGRQQPCRGHTFSSPPAQAGAGRGQPTAHPHPPPAAFCCRRGPRDAHGAGGAPAAPVVLGRVPRAALRTRGGIGVEGGEVKTAASSRGGPGAPLGSGGGARSLRAAAALPRGGSKGEEEAAAGQGSSHGECLPAPPPGGGQGRGNSRAAQNRPKISRRRRGPGGAGLRGEDREYRANIRWGEPQKNLPGAGGGSAPLSRGFWAVGSCPWQPRGVMGGKEGHTHTTWDTRHTIHDTFLPPPPPDPVWKLQESLRGPGQRLPL